LFLNLEKQLIYYQMSTHFLFDSLVCDNKNKVSEAKTKMSTKHFVVLFKLSINFN